MKRMRWTYKGIKRFYPQLDSADWLKICLRGQQYEKHPADVVAGIIKN
jgi:hypothetical protein